MDLPNGEVELNVTCPLGTYVYLYKIDTSEAREKTLISR
jgi:hypothetical protein